MESHLLQMRGLKRLRSKYRLIHFVASFTDAWIETKDSKGVHFGRITSHLLQMRGLKLITIILIIDQLMSHLLQMRGLKLADIARANIVDGRIFYRCVD